MELELDFAAFLPTHLCPSYGKVVTLLNQTVSSWPKGSAMLTGNKGIFTIKVYDKQKAQGLLGKKVEYFYEGDKSKKNIKVSIKEKEKFFRYVNPKYITLMGFERSPADLLTNEKIDAILKQFGDIIEPTQDVFAESFLTGKKKVRVDLNKEMDIPRDFHVQVESLTGRQLTASLRVYYRDQPYHCRRCTEQHVGDCPKFIAEREERQQIKKVKEENTKTILVGDSNFRCVNENGVMASVTAVTGGKIGHIVNQLEFENLEKIDTIIISAGQNCTNDADEVERTIWENRTLKEISAAEKVINQMMTQGKSVIMLTVPPVPCTQTTTRKKEARVFVNNQIAHLVQRVNAIDSKPGTAGILIESDSSYNPETDFKDDRHLTQQAMERRISKLDEILPQSRKLRSTILKSRATCDPYRGCYGAHPAGCNYCTFFNHNVQGCGERKKNAQGTKRPTVSGSNSPGSKSQKTG